MKEDCLTAGKVEVTCLRIERKSCQVHGASSDQRCSDRWQCGHEHWTVIPDTVENITIREHSDVEVRSEDLVEPGNFLIPEECIWHPNLARVSQCQVSDFIWRFCKLILTWSRSLTFHSILQLVLKTQSLIIPSLSQCDGEVVLHPYITDRCEVSNKDIDMNQGGGGGYRIICSRRSPSCVIHLFTKNLIQNLLLHLSVVHLSLCSLIGEGVIITETKILAF